jgi:hypothetical protein
MPAADATATRSGTFQLQAVDSDAKAHRLPVCVPQAQTQGMIHQSESDWDIETNRSYLVGDRSTDIVDNLPMPWSKLFLGCRPNLMERCIPK